jgi:hypothetical protein
MNLSELRQIKNERESMLRTNQYYIAQLTQMEIKISELKAGLQAKDTEIAYLNQKIQTFQDQQTFSNSNKTLEDQLSLLQAENEQLKIQVQEAEDLSQLKIQLEYAVKMKETFEEKYREAKTLLLTNQIHAQNDKSYETNYVKKELYDKIKEDLEMTKKKMILHQNECSILSSENEELLKKLELYEKESFMVKDKLENNEKTQINSGKTLSSPDSARYHISLSSTNSSEPKITTKTNDMIKSVSAITIPKYNRLNTSRGKANLMPSPKLVTKNEVAEYCPSFLRNKKSDVKTTPTPSVKKNSLNSFADDFPDEEDI